MVHPEDGSPSLYTERPPSGRSVTSAAESASSVKNFDERRREGMNIETWEKAKSGTLNSDYISKSWWEEWAKFVGYGMKDSEIDKDAKKPGPLEITTEHDPDGVHVSQETLAVLESIYPARQNQDTARNGIATLTRKSINSEPRSEEKNVPTSSSITRKNIRLFFCIKRVANGKSLTPKIVKKEFHPTTGLSDVSFKISQQEYAIYRSRYHLYNPDTETEYHIYDNRTLADCNIEDNQLLYLLPQSDGLRKSGKVGLMNIGNTCYMNSSLQCLLHTPELMYYFLNEHYKRDIAIDNPDGCKGQFAEEFYNLMRTVWMGETELITPYKFWHVLSEYYALFAEKDQHDTAELAETVLDGLMEDCNLATYPKPYFSEIEENASMSDSEMAERCWEYHKGRSESYITDVFHGQYRILTECPSCEFQSRKFDSFTVLHVGLPPPKRRLIVFTFVEVCGNTLPKKYAVEMTSDLNVKDLYIRAAKLVNCTAEEPWTQLCFVLDRKRRLTFLQLQDRIEHIKDHQTVLLYSYKDCDYGPGLGRRKICFVHQKRTTFSSYGNTFSTYAFPSRYEEKREIGYPTVLWLSEEEASMLSKKRALQDILESTLRPIKRQNYTHTTIHEKTTTLVEEETSKMDCNRSDVESTQAQHSSQASGSPRSDPMDTLNDVGAVNDDMEHESLQAGVQDVEDSHSKEGQNDIVDATDSVELVDLGDPLSGEIQVGPLPAEEAEEGETDNAIRNLFDDQHGIATEPYHNYASAFAASSNSSPVLQFSGGCSLAEAYSLSEAKNSPRADEAKTFVVDWETGADQHYNLHSLEHIASDKSAERVEERRRNLLETVTIYDCLKHEFSPHPHALDGDNLWKCGSCNEMVNGVKSMRLWKAPNILLIGLKRFDYCEERDRLIKLKQMVEFPMEGLDLRQFCATPLEEDSVYDLYGVCHHLGEGPKVGHYTSCVKSPNGKWHKFNDTWVTDMYEHQVVSQDAYLLYYRKKSIAAPSEQEILDTFREEEKKQWEEQARKLYKNELSGQTQGTSSDDTLNEQITSYSHYGKLPYNGHGENGSSSSNEMNNENDVTALSSQGQSSSSSFPNTSMSNATSYPALHGTSSSAVSVIQNSNSVIISNATGGVMHLPDYSSFTPSAELQWPSGNTAEALEVWNASAQTSLLSYDATAQIETVDELHLDQETQPDGWDDGTDDVDQSESGHDTLMPVEQDVTDNKRPTLEEPSPQKEQSTAPKDGGDSFEPDMYDAMAFDTH